MTEFVFKIKVDDEVTAPELFLEEAYDFFVDVMDVSGDDYTVEQDGKPVDMFKLFHPDA